ncbi:MAG: carboxypeptidase regulatory-like domain-containing protein [Acidobacteria bacterium]|nr:carboxypeptidase regulatory-like domain-containing protein [Acidobacteriota bacterium]
MKRTVLLILGVLLVALATAGTAAAQATTATILGTVQDEQGGVIPGATVTIRNVETNLVRTGVTDGSGSYRFPNLPVGSYEVTVELPGFTTFIRSGITLVLNQDAVVNVALRPATLEETVTVTGDAPLLNTTNSEIGVRFDTRRVSDLPVINSRDVFALALSAAGVSQLNAGQSNFAAGPNFAVNGMRTRSNNFMIDGQDSNDPSVSGRTQLLNNTDLIQEVRLITNQFAAEYGRSAGSVMSVITKSGTNSFRGSGFVFHNNNEFNARTNLDKNAGREKAPWRLETQFGGTLGGPVLRDRTFFFGSYQRWTQRFLGSGFTLNGAPTEAGRQVLQSAAGSRPQVQALLKFLPAAQAPIGRNATFTLGGQTYTVPLGSLTGSSTGAYNDNQYSARIDQQWGTNNVGGRYMYQESESAGAGQVTPTDLTTFVPSNRHAFTGWWTKSWGGSLLNEARFGFQRLDTTTTASDPTSEEIPSIEISELGLTGFNAAANRTAIGLAVNLPQYRKNNTFQYINTLSYVRGSHALKAGVDVRRVDVESFFLPTIRGRLAYSTLQSFINDVAEVVTINRALPGGQEVQFYDWTDFFMFFQDEWRVGSNLTLNLGLRYESPGNSIASLYPVSDSIVEANNGNPDYSMTPRPKRDTDNWQPRVGFNWNPQTRTDGLLGLLTGGNKLVVRGGYARTYDYAFININLNIASAFPFVAAINSPNLPGSFANLPNLQLAGLNPRTLARTIVSEDFRSPLADQFSLELQRELGGNLVWRLGYVGTRGDGLFQTLDGNPTVPFSSTVRQDPTRGVIRERANAASSIYHSMQTSLDKRFGAGLSAGVHYTWSRYIDTASDIFNISGGEVAIAQDSYDIKADRGLSSYDRPHRFTGNLVYELPFYRDQAGFAGKLAGGWSVATSFSFQSGSPFTALNGTDPTGALAGISGLVGTAIRPNINTDMNLSKMTIPDILAAGGASLFRPLCGNPSATCPGERVGNVGRNTLRSDGINNVDLSFIKNTRFGRQNMQIRVELFNAFNSRDFGIPESRINSVNFLNQWGTDGGGRRIWVATRYTF